jgi:energy-coupling factor transporter ATP-binding protein EcfA2
MPAKVMMETYEILSARNPFPGLRPFTIDENHLFFGREGHSETVLEYLAENRFVAVTGASGSGKSSLIYCGLIPTLYGGFIANAGSNWRIITTRPGNSPVENLAKTLADSETEPGYNQPGDIKKQINYTVLRRSSYGLVDVIRQMKIPKGENVLLIFDQFEELFRFKESRKDTTTLNETEAYIKLIVNAIINEEIPIYVVMTMRSDFNGECSQFQELTNLINKSNFLIPQMTRSDYREAILGPLAVGGARIDPQLLQHILNTIENKTDQLPVLQHAMMRTWEYWARYNDPGTSIKMRDYETAGKMENALSMHANEAYEELPEEGQQICKILFKSLTLKGADNKGIRHPASVKMIAEIAQTNDQNIIDVANKFREKGRSFITSSETGELDADSVLDISHESLMRIWDKLKVWVEEEFSSVQMYLRLSEAASLYQIGQSGLWRPPDLHLALNWRKTQRPTLEWAKKYNPAFEKVMVFLDASEKKYLQEEQNKVRIQRKALDRTRRFALSMAGVLFFVVLLLFMVNGQRAKMKDLSDELENRNFELELKTQEAERLRDIAEQNAGKAEVDAMYAQLKADSAESARERALLRSQLSEQESRLAQQKADSAERARLLAQQERLQAERTAQEARMGQSEAEKQKDLEFQRRMLSIAQTMATKSQDITDNNLKALLAQQAYLFNKQYSGQENHPDIYAGLHAALASFNGKDFNARIAHDGAVWSVCFVSGTNTFYSSGGDGKILEWDLNNNTRQYRTLVDNNFINKSMSISKNGRWLACATTSTGIQLFNLNQTSSQPQLLTSQSGYIESLCFAPDNKSLFTASNTGSNTGIITWWDLINDTHTQFISYNARIRSINISPNGSYLVAGTDNGIVKWDIRTKQQVNIYASANNFFNTVTHNNRGTIIASGDKKGTIYLFDANTNKLLRTFTAHNARVVDIEFSPDDTQLASCSNDSKIKIWNTRDLGIRPVEIIVEDWVLSVAFSPDGRNLVSALQNNKIYVWPTRAEYMANQICSRVSRNLTVREWEAYVGFDIDFQKTCPNK